MAGQIFLQTDTDSAMFKVSELSSMTYFTFVLLSLHDYVLDFIPISDGCGLNIWAQ